MNIDFCKNIGIFQDHCRQGLLINIKDYIDLLLYLDLEYEADYENIIE